MSESNPMDKGKTDPSRFRKCFECSALVRCQPATWAEIKAAVEAAGVKDNDTVYEIEIGPFPHQIVVTSDEYTDGLIISDRALNLLYDHTRVRRAG